MLADLRHFFAELTGGQKPQDQFAENDYRRAAAALLVHVATLDGELTDLKRRSPSLSRCMAMSWFWWRGASPRLRALPTSLRRQVRNAPRFWLPIWRCPARPIASPPSCRGAVLRRATSSTMRASG